MGGFPNSYTKAQIYHAAESSQVNNRRVRSKLYHSGGPTAGAEGGDANSPAPSCATLCPWWL